MSTGVHFYGCMSQEVFVARADGQVQFAEAGALSRADWFDKVQAHWELPPGASEIGRGAAGHTALRAAMRGGIGQKSAQVIVCAEQRVAQGG